MRPQHAFCLATALVAVTLLAASTSRADEPRADGEEEAIRRASAAYREAVNRGDLEAIAGFWTADADYVDVTGHSHKVKDRLEEAKRVVAERGDAARRSLKAETISVRIVTPGVAIEDGTFERTGGLAGQAPQGRYTAVWVKRDGRWLIDGVRESPIHAMSIYDHLKGLEWMVGDWMAEGDGATIDESCAWGPDKNYMLRDLVVRPKGEDPLSITQWIGWDPIHRRIHSFAFDSRGGYGEAIWHHDGDAWVATAAGVMPDGRHTSATNLYTKVDDDHAIWESVDHEVQGQANADTRYRVTRKRAAE